MTKQYKKLVSSASALALCLYAGNVLAADIIDDNAAPEAMEPTQERVLSGTMGVFYGHSFDVETSDNNSKSNYPSVGGFAKADIPFSETGSIQFDVYGEGNMASNISRSEDYSSGFLAGVHANYREHGSHLLGVFGGIGKVSNAGSGSGIGTLYLAGVEGQLHHGDFTFYGQVGYNHVEDEDGSDWANNALFARGAVRHYFNGGDGRLQADVMYMKGDISDDEFDGFAWGVEAEHLLADYGNGFVSGFLRYEGYSFDEDVNGGGGDHAHAHVVKAGVKVNWGYSNSMARDHMGAGVDFADMTRANSLIRGLE